MRRAPAGGGRKAPINLTGVNSPASSGQSGPVVGVVGGGQLARMMHQAAIGPGPRMRVLTDAPDDSAALVSGAVDVGNYRSLEDLMRFAGSVDVLTFDHEHVPPEHLRQLADRGVAVRPGPDALLHAQDKVVMRRRLSDLGLPVPRWVPEATPEAVAEVAEATGWPVVVKAVRGGYDGRGVWLLAGAHELHELRARVGDLPLYAEAAVPLRRELAAVVARSSSGEVRAWPAVETVQRNGICMEVLAPAPGLSAGQAAEAERIAVTVATELGVVGVLAVELFERPDGQLLINELAMRPHNSGHWSIEGSRTSQFEQHLRAVAGWPLGDTSTTAPVTVMANLLGSDDPAVESRIPEVYSRDPAVKVHLYGKQSRPGRKLGHVTVLGQDVGEVRRRALQAVAVLRGELPADGVGDSP